jgi:hypothetical protein
MVLELLMQSLTAAAVKSFVGWRRWNRLVDAKLIQAIQHVPELNLFVCHVVAHHQLDHPV